MNTKKKILVVTPTPTHPQNAGNRQRIFSLLSEIRKRGYEVHVLYDGGEYQSSHVKTRRNLSEMRKYWDGFYYIPNAASIKYWKWGSHHSNFIVFNVYRVLVHILSRTYLLDRFRDYPDQISGMIGQSIKKCTPGVYKRIKKYIPNGKFVIKKEKEKKFEGIDERYNSALDVFIPILKTEASFDVVMVEYVFMSKALEHFDSKVTKIIDTHDVFANRNDAYKEAGLSEVFFSTSKDEEIRGLLRADIIIAIQDDEAAYFSSVIDTRVVTIGHPVTLINNKSSKINAKPQLLFVGAANTANIHAMEWFVEHVWPNIRSKVPEITLTIAGKVSHHIHAPNVIRLGEVKSLRQVYERTDIVINPTQVGTGLKIKSIEALGYGRPLVTTTHAAAGLGSEQGFNRADNEFEFSDKILNLIKNRNHYIAMQKKATKKAQEYNTTIGEAIDSIFAEREVSSIISAFGTQSDTRKKRPFIIFTWARTGASTLSRVLNQYKDISIKEEPFNHSIGVHVEENDMRILESVIEEVFKSYTGIKHNWGLSFKQNARLLSDPRFDIVFLWRKDALLREISLFISRETKKWGAYGADREFILNYDFPPMDIGMTKHKMDLYLEEVARYRRLLNNSDKDFYELSYEDLFGEHITEEGRLLRVYDTLHFLRRSTMISDKKFEKAKDTLNPSVTKLNSQDTYRRIPNIDKVFKQLDQYRYHN